MKKKRIFGRINKRMVLLLITALVVMSTVSLPLMAAPNPVPHVIKAKSISTLPKPLSEGVNLLASNKILPDLHGKTTGSTVRVAAPVPVAAKSSTSQSVQLVAALLTKASSLLGVPYRFGGTNPQNSLDCSAYVQLVFRTIGINLPRSTFGQIKMGTPVSYDQLRPGDLVFFSSDGPGPTHVGIYTGNGRFINETPPKVEVDTIITPSGSKTFYGRTYYGARRIISN